MADLDDEIRDRVYDLLQGALALDQFESWFVGESWDDRTPLVVRVDHVLAEKSLLSEDQILDELKGLVVTIERREFAPAIVTASEARTFAPGQLRIFGNDTIRRRLEFADTPPAAAHA